MFVEIVSQSGIEKLFYMGKKKTKFIYKKEWESFKEERK